MREGSFLQKRTKKFLRLGELRRVDQGAKFRTCLAMEALRFVSDIPGLGCILQCLHSHLDKVSLL